MNSSICGEREGGREREGGGREREGGRDRRRESVIHIPDADTHTHTHTHTHTPVSPQFTNL